MKSLRRLMLTGCFFAGIATCHATNSVLFCRIVSTQATRITSFRSDGVVTFSNAVRSNAQCRIEWSTSPTSRLWSAGVNAVTLQTTNRLHCLYIPTNALPADTFYLQGNVAYFTFEGGFYCITNSTGAYLPHYPWMIPQVVGARVSGWARLRNDLFSIYMCGPIVDLFEDPHWFDYFN